MKRISNIFLKYLSAVCLLLILSGVQAQAPDEALNEEVIEVVKSRALFDTQLETTIFKPDGAGPFPIVVVNHGKEAGDARGQKRYRPLYAVRFFMQMGYVVIVPMRQGFSNSSGNYIGAGCNIESNGKTQADDVRIVLDHVTSQAWADKSRILVVGQSHGGWTSLAFGTFNYPGVKGIVNFAGGLRQTDCAAWEYGLARAAAAYGEETKVPSLWFYGDNDSFFSPSTFNAMYQRYTEAGGRAKLVAFGKFGRDSHSMFGSRQGQTIWQPLVRQFMAELGLPVESISHAPLLPMAHGDTTPAE